MQTTPAGETRSISGEHLPYWQGLDDGRLMLQYCATSERYQHYPRPLGLVSGRRELQWRQARGDGCIYALTRVSGIPLENIALVELVEGVRILADLLVSDASRLVIGARVRFSAQASAVHRAPVFEPA